MTNDLITLTIEGEELQVPRGTLIVDAAKRIEREIPVFCYHPKLDPVGMCRMCLVEIGRPVIDRESGKPVLDEQGEPKIEFRGNLETACTTTVGEGWQVRINSENALGGRRQIVEHLLSSHPLDCPICDKGGECPLQNLTMEHGPGKSRFVFDDKIQLDKHVALGELIYLDRERCIQCARCTRFQSEIAGDPVIGFYNRGRRLEIVTFSDPGFDSYFSGNTTDICPVGALTTADFRFGARPWELNQSASICPHCPVGCNLTLNTRREAKTGGSSVIKRVMPRQNESVNEIWICDKGRFVHQYATSPERILHPMLRKNGDLVRVGWEQALKRASEGLRKGGSDLFGLAGGRLSNEDYFTFGKLVNGLSGRTYVAASMGGAEQVRQVGIGAGSNLGEFGSGDVMLVVATDLHEEAPVWWLRAKQAVERGAVLILANARKTRLDDFAHFDIRPTYGHTVHTVLGMLHHLTGDKDLERYAKDESLKAAAVAISQAANFITFFGSEGLDYQGSDALAAACASLHIGSDHIGRPNNGLIPVWPSGNMQGALDVGLLPTGNAEEGTGLEQTLSQAKAGFLVGVDLAADRPDLIPALERLDFLVVQELFLTDTARLADVVLPAQSFVEREGTFTTGERRVQRFYLALRHSGECLPDWKIAARLGAELGMDFEIGSAAAVFEQLAASTPGYEAMNYSLLSETKLEWPHVGGADLFFGGTSYRNLQGLGAQTKTAADQGEQVQSWWKKPNDPIKADHLMIPITKLYADGTILNQSELLAQRKVELEIRLNPEDAAQIGAIHGSKVQVSVNGRVEEIPATIDADVPAGVVLIPRSSFWEPSAIDLKVVKD
jgi:NADH-quinone oxidoreductase subunit G